jgi:hypothetical protein
MDQELSNSDTISRLSELTVDAAQPFEYEPLDTSIDCIRLLSLDALEEGLEDGIVRCSLNQVKFSEKPRYEALSYTWGAPGPTRRIWVNGKPVDVRENLRDALFCLQQSRQPRLLWADAICIDQRNAQERQHQVGFMEFIYTRAVKVLIWLGRADLRIEQTFAGMSKHGEDVTDDQKWECLDWACTQSYWTRLWVAQELALSRDLRVYVGPNSQRWEKFFSYLMSYKYGDDKDYWRTSTRRGLEARTRESDLSSSDDRYYYRRSRSRPEQRRRGSQRSRSRIAESSSKKRMSLKTSNRIQTIMGLNTKRQDRHGSENRLEELLEDFKYAECEEPRDKIYALLGLAHDCRSIQADYLKPIFGLYADVMAYFCRAQKLEDDDANAFDRSLRITRFSQLIQSFLGSPACPEGFQLTNDIVVATGAVGGIIRLLGPTYDEMCDSSDIRKEWKQAFSNHYSAPSDLKNLREADEAFSHFLFDDEDEIAEGVFSIDPQNLYSRATPDGGFWDGEEENWRKRGFDPRNLLSKLISKRSMSEGSMSEELLNYLKVLASAEAKMKEFKESHVRRGFWDGSEDNWSRKRRDVHPQEQPVLLNPPKGSSVPRLFLGSNLLLGLAPPEAKEGDVICQFWETDVSVLLRKEIESGIYRIVGRLYLSTGYLRKVEAKVEAAYRDWIQPYQGADTVRIEMDLRTLAKLTAWKS